MASAEQKSYSQNIITNDRRIVSANGIAAELATFV